VTGNEIQDCGAGIRAGAVSRLLLVGNDCRDNTTTGIRVDEDVSGGLVALNHCILNGPIDLEVLGSRIRCRDNKVDREGQVPGSDDA
jgi:hypothetical protein